MIVGSHNHKTEEIKGEGNVTRAADRGHSKETGSIVDLPGGSSGHAGDIAAVRDAVRGWKSMRKITHHLHSPTLQSPTSASYLFNLAKHQLKRKHGKCRLQVLAHL